MHFKDIFNLVKEAVQGFAADNATRLSAALSYYSIFSLAPLLVIVVSVIGLIYGQEAAQGQMSEQISGLVGEEAGRTIEQAVAATGESKKSGIIASLVGFGVLLFGATRVFAELKDALNLIWGVRPRPGQPVVKVVRDRLLSLSLVLGVGFLLLLSLVLSAILTAVSEYLLNGFALPEFVWKTGDFLISLAVITLLFAMIFKVLPAVSLRWRDVMLGALTTALLFATGKSAMAWYLGTSSVGSAFGAAGSLVVLLLWIYFGTSILFFGAEITKAFSKRYGNGVVPRGYAELVPQVDEKTAKKNEEPTEQPDKEHLPATTAG